VNAASLPAPLGPWSSVKIGSAICLYPFKDRQSLGVALHRRALKPTADLQPGAREGGTQVINLSA